MEPNRGKPLDLTLRLGPSSPERQENQDVGNNELHGPSSSMGIGTNEVGPPNFLFYPGYPPQDHGSPNRRRGAAKVCRVCGANTTPLWRTGPDGPQTLCNACGLKHNRALKKGAE